MLSLAKWLPSGELSPRGSHRSVDSSSEDSQEAAVAICQNVRIDKGSRQRETSPVPSPCQELSLRPVHRRRWQRKFLPTTSVKMTTSRLCPRRYWSTPSPLPAIIKTSTILVITLWTLCQPPMTVAHTSSKANEQELSSSASGDTAAYQLWQSVLWSPSDESPTDLDANTAQRHKRAIAFFSKPMRVPAIRKRLMFIRGWQDTAASRHSRTSTYNRISNFVKNRYQTLALSLNNKLHSKRKAKDDGSHSDSSDQLSANVTTIYDKPVSEAITSSSVSDDNSTNDAEADNYSRRHDKYDDVPLDSDALLDSSSKSSDNSPYLSPTLNVIDVEPDKTKIAHNILVVRNKHSKPDKAFDRTDADKSSQANAKPLTVLLEPPSPVVISSDLKHFRPSIISHLTTKNPETVVTSTTTSNNPFDDPLLEFVPIKNNHRPSSFMSFSAWKLQNKMKTSTTTQASTISIATRAPETLPPITTAKVSTNIVHQSGNTSTVITLTSGQPLTTTNEPHSPIVNGMTDISLSEFWKFPTTVSSSKPIQIMTTKTSTPIPVTIKEPSLMDYSGQHSTTGGAQWSSTNRTTVTTTKENPSQSTSTEGSTDYRVTELDSLSTEEPFYLSTKIVENGFDSTLNDSKETTWGDTMQPLPLDDTPTTTTTVNPFWLSTTSGEDNSDELLKEYEASNKDQNESTGNWQMTTFPYSVTSTASSVMTTNANNSQVPFYHESAPQSDYLEEQIYIFKNNHGKPKRKPVFHKPPNRITARPPYLTDFVNPNVETTKKPPLTVMNIASHRVKQPEDAYSGSITVLDPPFVPNSFMKLPINTTIVHNNILVPMKEGRPRPSYPIRPTTQFPIYPVVAGVSNWQAQTTPWLVPAMTTSLPNVLDDLSPSPSNDNVSHADPDRIELITSRPSIAAHAISSTTAKSKVTFKPSTTTAKPSTARPSTPSYVNAIYAPPMPIFRPSHSVESNPHTIRSWFRRLGQIFGLIIPNSGQVSMLSLLRNMIYTLMVVMLPPLALSSFFMVN